MVRWLAEQASLLEQGAAAAASETERQAWALLVHFRQWAVHLWRIVEAYQRGDKETALQRLAEARDFVQGTEPEVHRFADGSLQLGLLNALAQCLGQ